MAQVKEHLAKELKLDTDTDEYTYMELKQLRISSHLLPYFRKIEEGSYGVVLSPGIINYREQTFYNENLVTKIYKPYYNKKTKRKSYKNVHLSNQLGQKLIFDIMGETLYKEYFLTSTPIIFSTEIIDLFLINSNVKNKNMVETFRKLTSSLKRPTMLNGITMLKANDVSDLYLFLGGSSKRDITPGTLTPQESFQQGFYHLIKGCEELANKSLMLFDMKPYNVVYTVEKSITKIKHIDLDKSFIVSSMKEYINFAIECRTIQDKYFCFRLNICIFEEISKKLGHSRTPSSLTFEEKAECVLNGINTHCQYTNSEHERLAVINMITGMMQKQRNTYNANETKFFNMITGMMQKDRKDYNDDENNFFRFFITQCWIGQLSQFFSGYGNKPYYLFTSDKYKKARGATFQHNVIFKEFETFKTFGDVKQYFLQMYNINTNNTNSV